MKNRLEKMLRLQHKHRRKFLRRNPTTLDHLTISEIDGGWFVMNGETRVAGPLPSNAAAWSWIDRHATR